MNKMKVWKDGEVRSGPLTISVVKNHLHNPGFWSMHCHPLGMNTVDLKLPSSEDASLAQACAINLVKSRLRELSSELSKIS